MLIEIINPKLDEWMAIPEADIESIVTYDRRADEVFDSGSFSFVSTDINVNLPPLTPCKIDGEYWLCSSECNEVIPSNPKKYNHNVSLIEPTYLMTCYILGTKALSNLGANTLLENKLQIVFDIINQKYQNIFGARAKQFVFKGNKTLEFVGESLMQGHPLDDTTNMSALEPIKDYTDYKGINLDEIYDSISSEVMNSQIVVRLYVENLNLKGQKINIKGVLNINFFSDVDTPDFTYNLTDDYTTKSFTYNQDKPVSLITITIDRKPQNAFLSMGSTLPSVKREFAFGSGTTFFQAVVEMTKEVDLFPRIRVIEAGQPILVEWDNLSSGNEFVLEESKIISKSFNQNTDTYTRILESEILDVEDEDNLVSIKGITVRSEDFVINADNQKLILPTRIKRIKGFGIQGKQKFVANKYAQIPNKYLKSDTERYIGSYMAWSSLYGLIVQDTAPDNVDDAVRELLGIGALGGEVLYTAVGKVEYISGDSLELDNPSLTNQILEKAQYDLLKAEEQPKYCYYTYNSNVIDGIYKYYKDTLWDNIFGTKVYPFLRYAMAGEEYLPKWSTLNPSIRGGLSLVGLSDYNPMSYQFYIEYYPITSCFITSEANKDPFNELDGVKAISRSFEFAAPISDFNQLVPAINKTNKMVGMPEVTIGYHGNSYPKPMQKVIIKNQFYYVSSVQTSKTLNDITSYINLVSDYSKVAEVFGVKTQFESTRLPLTGIVDRIVYLGKIKNFGFKANGLAVYSESFAVRPNFGLYQRGTFLNYDGRTLMVVEAQDNYSFGASKNSNAGLVGEVFENKQNPYGNRYNEMDTYAFVLLAESNLTKDELDSLPNFNSYKHLVAVSTRTDVVVHKDARERLIFVAEVVTE